MASLLLSSTSHRPPTFSTGKPPHLPSFKVSCNANKEEYFPGKLDRRNLLLGMGAAGINGGGDLANATPISGPDISKCSLATNINTRTILTDLNCCPPPPDQIHDYELPEVSCTRIRPPAHLARKEHTSQLRRGIELMKCLGKDDPRSFMQQANVHCAYCNLAYEQTGDPTQKLQIHQCWLFYPWHRWYLYFYERILGKLLDDSSFALPFWNYDNPVAMPMPNMFTTGNDAGPTCQDLFNDQCNSLYDPRRNPCHLPPSPVDLRYGGGESPSCYPVMITCNLTEMYTEMVTNATTLEDFYGAKYVVGSSPEPGAGSVERGSHTAVHRWVGQNTVDGLDLGNFYSASRDPIFFALHANVDRLWTVWQERRTLDKKSTGFNSRDWCEATFLFYDEEKRLVRVSVKDALDNRRMGYDYQHVENPWLKSRCRPPVSTDPAGETVFPVISDRVLIPMSSDPAVFPVNLDKVVRVMVDRAKGKRSKEEKEKEGEMLMIEGIDVDTAKALRFEVYVGGYEGEDQSSGICPAAGYAGTYAQVPMKKSRRLKSKIRLGLTELLEDLEIEDADKILVSLVPKSGGEDITIGGIRITYFDYASDV